MQILCFLIFTVIQYHIIYDTVIHTVQSTGYTGDTLAYMARADNDMFIDETAHTHRYDLLRTLE